MLFIIVTALFILGSLYYAFRFRKNGRLTDSDFWGPVGVIGVTLGLVFGLLIPSLARDDIIQYTIPVDGGSVHRTNDLQGGPQYYIESDGELISINNYGQGIGFDVGTANEASWVCERTKSWAAPYSIDNDNCWWYVVSERS